MKLLSEKNFLSFFTFLRFVLLILLGILIYIVFFPTSPNKILVEGAKTHADDDGGK